MLFKPKNTLSREKVQNLFSFISTFSYLVPKRQWMLQAICSFILMVLIFILICFRMLAILTFSSANKIIAILNWIFILILVSDILLVSTWRLGGSFRTSFSIVRFWSAARIYFLMKMDSFCRSAYKVWPLNSIPSIFQ